MATSRLSTRRVEWRVQVGTSNKAAQGLVIFEASVSYIPDPLAAGGPRTAIPEPVAAVLDAGGYACTPDPTNPAKAGERGAELFTTDSLGADGGDWTWTARPQLRSVNGIQMANAVPAFSFAVPTGTGSLDLAEVQKVPASPGLGTEQAVALVLRAEKAIQDAVNVVGDTVGAAVSEEIASRNLLETKTTPEAVAFTITDSSQRRSWLEIAPDGGMTKHAAGLVTERTVETIKADGLLPIPAEVDTSAAVYGITDSSGRRSWIEIDKDGRPTDHAKSLIFEDYQVEPSPEEQATELMPEIVGTSPNRRLYANNGYTAARHLITAAGDPRNAVSTRDGHILFDTDAGRMHSAVPSAGVFPAVGSTDLAFFGDSLTDSGPDDTYPSRVSAVTGLPFFQGGVAGQASADIAIRQGGLRPAVTVAGNSIPASGPVAVTALLPASGYRVNGSGSFAFTGTLAGVQGNLVHNLTNDTWVFTRSEPGAVVPCPPGSRFTASAISAAHNENKTQIIWAGRNNFSTGATLADARRDIAAMVANLKPYHKRFLVLGVLNSITETRGTTRYNQIVEHNARLAAEYGPLFYDIRRPFIDRGLALAGIPATSADLANIANDAPPPSLMADDLHPSNPAGATVLGDLVGQLIISKGWHL